MIKVYRQPVSFLILNSEILTMAKYKKILFFAEGK